MPISLSSPELFTFFSHNLKIQNGGGRPVGFSGMSIWPFRRVDVIFVFCSKCGSKICYSHWDRRTYPSEIHLMTSTRINFRFRLLVTWTSPHGRDASSHKIWCRYLYPIRSYWHFSEIKEGGSRHLGFSGCEFGYYGVLIVWYLCSVPTVVQLYVIVAEIDALMLLTFIRWRHAN